MKKIALVILVFSVACLSACGGPQRKAFEQNRSLWESQAIHHYRFNLEISCFCPWHAMMPLAIEVQDGEILSMVASNGEDITPYLDTFRPHGTVEGLFDRADSAISSHPYKLEIQYDVTYGFPASIGIIQYRLITDSGMGYHVTNFEVLP